MLLFSRMTAEPMCNSARESASAQSLSPVVIGRLIEAATQSLSPAGWNETDPRRKLSRATRAGGSSESAAAARWGRPTAISRAALRLTQAQLRSFA